MKKIVFGLLVVILLIGTVACSSREESGDMVKPIYTQTTGIMVPPVTVGSSRDGNEIPAPTITVAVPTTIPAPAPTIITGKDGDYFGSAVSAAADRMVIRTAYLSLVVDDVSSSLAQITSLASTYGGYVVNSDIREDQSRLYASISFRVDSAKFNEALQALRNMAADVRSESTSGQDVTSEYTDLTSRLRNLEASEAQLLELMKQAGKVDEILEVQRELADTRERIELIKGQMQYLEQSSSLALISTSLEQSKLTVEFIAETRTAKEGQSVQFIPTISGGFSPYSYQWDFGDGETSTEGAPAHAYHKDGAFTVTLKITDDKGNTADAVRDDYITVLPGWSAGNIAGSAWNGLVGFFRVLLDIIIWLGILSPIWIIILVILYFTWWRRRKKAK